MTQSPSADVYRRGVGLVVFNAQGLVWIGKRNPLTNAYQDTPQWQLPQGGIEAQESPWNAAVRELHEETGISTELTLFLGETDWLTYTIPPAFIGKTSSYKGQHQKWFALRFLGKDHQINTDVVAPPEFIAWRWEELSKITSLVIPFKRGVYEQVIHAFRGLPEQIARS